MNCPLCSSLRRDIWCEIESPVARYWACAECGLIWLDEKFRLSAEQERAFYGTHQNALTDPRYMAHLGRVAHSLVCRLSPGAYGLDFGCGPTEGMKALLSPQGFRLESYDPLFFSRVNLLNFRYDFVICSEAAEHFFTPAAEFERLSECVRPGGWLAVSSHLAPSREKFSAWWYRRDPTHVAFYRRETVSWIAQRWNWDLVELESPLWLLQKR